MTRLEQPERAALDAEQTRIYNEIVASRGSIEGPFRAWLHRPAFADRAQQLGEYVRYRTSLEPRLSELAILVTARFWDCQIEWTLHEPCAREGGLDEAIIDAVRRRHRPDFSRSDEASVHDYATQLLRDHVVTDASYDAVLAELGNGGVVDLTGIVGYYSMVAMTLNACQVPLGPGREPTLVDCPTYR